MGFKKIRQSLYAVRKTKKAMKKLCDNCKIKSANAINTKNLYVEWCDKCAPIMKSVEEFYNEDMSKGLVEDFKK